MFKGRASLQEAVKEGDYKAVKNIVRINALFGIGIDDLRDHSGRTALHHAAMRSNAEMLGLLVDLGADVNVRADRAWTAMHYAALSDNFHGIRLLAELELDVNSASVTDETPLHAASYTNAGLAVRELINLNAEVNAQNVYGETPLHHAVKQGNVSAAELLMMAKADKYLEDNDGQTPEKLAKELASNTNNLHFTPYSQGLHPQFAPGMAELRSLMLSILRS